MDSEFKRAPQPCSGSPWIMSSRQLYWILQVTGWTAFTCFVWLSYGPYLNTPAALWSEILKIGVAISESFLLHAICRRWWQRTPVLSISIVFTSVLMLAITDEVLIENLSHAIWNRPQHVRIATVLRASLILLFCLGTWCASYYAVKSLLMLDEQANRIEKARIIRKNSEVAAFRFQLPHHLITELLTGLEMILAHKGPHVASEAISDLADLLASILDRKDRQFASVESEIQHVRNFLQLQKSIMLRSVELETHVGPHLMSRLVPRWLLAPLAGMLIEKLPLNRQQNHTLLLEVQEANSILSFQLSSNFTDSILGRDEELVQISDANELLRAAYDGEGDPIVEATSTAIIIKIPLTRQAGDEAY